MSRMLCRWQRNSIPFGNVKLYVNIPRRYENHKIQTKVHPSDFEKTYDLDIWDFLFYMMTRLGFDDKWIGWVNECLESSSVFVLVNRSATTKFKPSRGLRQGDPMAPFFLLFVVEGMTRLV